MSGLEPEGPEYTRLYSNFSLQGDDLLDEKPAGREAFAVGLVASFDVICDGLWM